MNRNIPIAKPVLEKEDFFNARKTTLISIFNYPESRLKEKIYLFLNPRKSLQ